MTPHPRCPNCTSTYCPIPSDGPPDATIYCYGERPGQSEEFKMRRALQRGYLDPPYCFIGDAGREYNENYLTLAGLQRSQIKVGNVVMCGAKDNKTPTDKEIMACAEFHIRPELSEGQPEIVILMGASACKLSPIPIDLEADHGIPFCGRIFDWEGYIVPMYHPAAGLHNTTMMTPLLEDWTTLGRWIRTGDWQWAIPYEGKKDYRLVRTENEVWDYFEEMTSRPFPHRVDYLAALDTENHGGVDWSIQVSIYPHTAIMALEDDQQVVGAIADCLHPYEMVFHYSPADLPRTRRLGLDNPYRDTHIEAYNLGLPQGLKILAKRILGRSRASWEELVGGASRDMICMWLCMALDICQEEWRLLEPRAHKRTGRPISPKITKHEAEGTISWVLQHTLKSTEYDPWEKLVEFGAENWIGQMQERLQENLPIKGIANCRMEDAVHYGCSDADDTLCIALDFIDRRERFNHGLNIQEEDKDELCISGSRDAMAASL